MGWEELNRTLFLKINAEVGTPSWIIDATAIIANDLIYLVPILLTAMWLWGTQESRAATIRNRPRPRVG